MVTLINEVHFWTLKDNVLLKESDIGCFKIYSKGATLSVAERKYLEEKQAYAESQGLTWIPKNSRPHKLRDTMKEFEEIMNSQRCVSVSWKSASPLQMFFNSGILISMPIKDGVFEVESIIIDRFLVGKLVSEHVVEAILEDKFIIVSYVEGKMSFIYFGKNGRMLNPEQPQLVSKLANLDAKVVTLDVVGSPGRRLERKLALNVIKDLALVWWSDSAEVRPWMPLAADRDKATAVVYALGSQSCEMLCYGRIEHDPLSAVFSRYQPNHIIAVEENVSSSGDITAHICTYEAARAKFYRISETIISLQGHIITCQWNETEDKLLLACDDCSLIIYDSVRQVTQQAMAQIAPVEIAWHPSGTIAVLASEVGQIQCFDSALSSIDIQLLSEGCTSTKVLELTPYFRQQPTLWHLAWKGQQSPGTFQSSSAKTMLCLLFERGPLLFLSLSLGIVSCGTLGPVQLIVQYLKRGQVDEAVCLLLSIDWSHQADVCYQSLSKIVNFLLRRPLDIDTEAQLEAALGSFYAPASTIPEVVLTKYGEHVKHLARRFFFHLLRYHRFEKAFLLAVDLECQDLFMNLHYAALQKGEMKLAAVSLQHVERLERGSEVTTEDESVDDDGSECTVEEQSEEDDAAASQTRQANVEQLAAQSRNLCGLQVMPSAATPLRIPSKFSQDSDPVMKHPPSPPPPPLPPRMPRSLQAHRNNTLHSERLQSLSWCQSADNHASHVAQSQQNGSKSAVLSEGNVLAQDQGDGVDEDVESTRVKFIHFGVV